MLKLNEVILVDDPSSVLDHERGIFEVLSPLGDLIRVSCSPGLPADHQHVSFHPEKKRADFRWEVRKIAELPGDDEPTSESSQP
jgi:hypothetical protein